MQEMPAFYLRPNDRVVFYGDSITEHRFYTMFVETFVLTRFPSWQVRFFNAGWGGDKVSGAPGRPIDVRLRRDVVAHLPTVVTVMLGMNDGGWRAYDPTLFAEYSQGYEHIADVLQTTLPKARVTLLRPSPFDDVAQPPRFPGGYNEVLQRYGEFVANLAQRRGMAVADLNAPVVEAVARAAQVDEEQAKKIMGDRAHPLPAGHLLMAMALLRAWNAPSFVTTVDVDAATLQAVRSVNSSVTQLQWIAAPPTKDALGVEVPAPEEDATLTWTQQDKALPFPVDRSDPTMALALRSSDFDQLLNNQTLRVAGLRKSHYRLKINGLQIGNFPAEQLAEGINLAQLSTPMTKQAQRVYDLTNQRNLVQYTTWRQVQLPLATVESSKYRDVLRALGSMENDLITKQREAAQPQPCVYELTPIVDKSVANAPLPEATPPPNTTSANPTFPNVTLSNMTRPTPNAPK